MPYERVVENIASKIHLIPRYQQRVVPAPFNIGHPTWEWDPNFDIGQHVKRVRINPPGNDAQLQALAAKLFEGMLDRNKPLWEIYMVEGLEGPRSAMVSKVHHCLVDGVSGIELLMIVLDVSPNPPPPMPAPEREPAPAIPPAPTRLVDAIFDNMRAELDRISDYSKSAVDAVVTGDSRVRTAMRSMEAAQPYFVHAGGPSAVQQAVGARPHRRLQRVLLRRNPRHPRRVRRHRERRRPDRPIGRAGPLPRAARREDRRAQHAHPRARQRAAGRRARRPGQSRVDAANRGAGRRSRPGGATQD